MMPVGRCDECRFWEEEPAQRAEESSGVILGDCELLGRQTPSHEVCERGEPYEAEV